MRSCCKLFLFSLQISSYWSPFLFPVVIFWFNFATLWFMKIINDENFPHHHLILKNYESTFCLKHCATGTIPDWKTASCNVHIHRTFLECVSITDNVQYVFNAFSPYTHYFWFCFLKKAFFFSIIIINLCTLLSSVFLHTFCLFVFMVLV